MLTLDCPGPACPLQLSVYSWPGSAEKRKMSFGWLVVQTAGCGSAAAAGAREQGILNARHLFWAFVYS